MKICLKTQARQASPQTVVVRVQDRIPERVSSSVDLNCTYKVEACSDYYLLTLEVSSTLAITCLRCLGEFPHTYTNHTRLAVCASDEIAETLMMSFDCINAKDNQIDLMDILTDELHLFLPEKHADVTECDRISTNLSHTTWIVDEN